MGGRGVRSALPDQRPELCPLQNLRHQGSEREHHLGPAGGWWRTELRGDVKHDSVTPCTDGPAAYGHDKATLERFWDVAGPVRAASLTAWGELSSLSLRLDRKHGIVGDEWRFMMLSLWSGTRNDPKTSSKPRANP